MAAADGWKNGNATPGGIETRLIMAAAWGRDSQIWRNIFPLCNVHFSLDPTKWIADECSTFLNPSVSTSVSNHSFVAGLTHYLIAFIHSTLKIIFSEVWITRDEGNDFS